MTIPARYAPLLFSALLSAIMVAVVAPWVRRLVGRVTAPA